MNVILTENVGLSAGCCCTMPRRLSGTHPPRQPAPLTSPSTPNPDDPAAQSDSERDAIFIRRRMPLPDDRPASPSPRPPPSSFVFPFQAYPGNPDPGTSIPGVSRRRSSVSSDYHALSPYSPSTADLERPYAPFMAEGSSSNSLYRNSAAANLSLGEQSATAGSAHSSIPRTTSNHSFRTPFLSPASRPTSSLWSPPNYNQQLVSLQTGSTPNDSSSALPLKSRAPLPSTRLHQKLEKSDKPWLQEPDRGARLSWWITFSCIILGIAGAGALCYLGATEVKKLDNSQLCLVLNENFDGGSLDDSVWSRDVELGGFGYVLTVFDNGFFQPDRLVRFSEMASSK